ncbi:uncharacterized protein LOC110989924 [Acanthaster planci]|uniref:Uncharacterized protein LOC110989924 n=1 Tax=Acanthaster planci TaxID=133434 RepID=A0A8B7ZYY7_ACAPL|nr:uncharacterized protein LOC110989924 [Acanthaster planci]
MESASLVNSMEETAVGTGTPNASQTQNRQNVQTGSLLPSSLQPGSQPSSGRSSPYQTQTLHAPQPGNPPSTQGPQYTQQPPPSLGQNQTVQQQVHQPAAMQQQQQYAMQQRQYALQQQLAMQQGSTQHQPHPQGTQRMHQQQYVQQQPAQLVQQQAPRAQVQPVVQPPPSPPSQEQLALFNFNPASNTLLHSLGVQHPKSGFEVTGCVQGALTEVMTATSNLELPHSCQMEYDVLLDGVLFSEETVSDNHIAFHKVVFQYLGDTKSDVAVPPKPEMTQGRAYLTNKRLILLSAEETKGLNLTREGTVRTNAYSVRGHKVHSLRYESIPLSCFRGADFSTVSGCSVTARIQGFFPDTVEQCLQLCSPQKYRERWQPQQATTASIDNRVINLGAFLPPWGTKCSVQVYMSKAVELDGALQFVGALQQAAPSLHPESFSIPRE